MFLFIYIIYIKTIVLVIIVPKIASNLEMFKDGFQYNLVKGICMKRSILKFDVF